MSAVDGIDEFAAKLAGILKEKNESYGDSLAKVPTMLSFIFPEIPVEKLTLICAFSRALEKFGRMASNPTAFGEDPWTDVAAAFLVHANIDRLKREAKAKSGMAQREAMPGLNIDSIYDEPDDNEALNEPNGRIKRDMAHAEVTQEPTGWHIVCFEGRDRQFFNDFGGFWAHDIRDATSFLSQEAAELCLRKREGSSCE